jgi:flagellar biosynthesis/type III secretory pathway protein FliH
MYLELTTGEAREYETLAGQGPHREVRTVQMTWSQRIKSEGFKLGRQEGRKEGRKEGREEGMRQLLLHLLEQRFGLLPEIVRLKVEAIDSPRRLTRLSGQVLVASSLEELGLR